ncbi:MAG: guanine deaminase [Rhodoferax sp.]
MHAYRASLLYFDPDATPAESARFERDGVLLVAPDAQGCQRIVALGAYAALRERLAHVPTTHWPGRVIAPGFVDLHSHYPQVDVIGAPANGLLPWLERYTFPAEQGFAQPAHAAEVASFFTAELLRHGVTTALTFATSHPSAVDALMAQAQRSGMRLISGLCLMDRNAPPALCNAAAPGRSAAEQSLLDTEALIARWHGVGRLGYAITPRFAPTSTPAQLAGAGELAARYPEVWIQSHVAENRDEIAWVHQLFPQARSYLDVYAGFGLLRPRAVYAHCIYLDDTDRALLRERGAAAAVCPTSNLFLGSGAFDYASARRLGVPLGLGNDVGGGTSFSPFHTMLAAYTVGRDGQTKAGVSLHPQDLWWQHTLGAARALGLHGLVGNLVPGLEADFIVLDPQATPLLARRTQAAQTLDEWLFAFIVLGDERAVVHTAVAGAPTRPDGPANAA